MSTVWALVCLVAERLTGGPVVIRYREPQYKGHWGVTHRNPAGKIVIDLSPRLNDDDALFLKVLCHEAAHARLHAPAFARSNTDRPSATVIEPKPSPARKAARAKMETEADELAARWLAYAKGQGAKIQRTRPDLSDLEAQLIALARWE